MSTPLQLGSPWQGAPWICCESFAVGLRRTLHTQLFPDRITPSIAIDSILQVIRDKGGAHRLQFFAMTLSRSRRACARAGAEAASAGVVAAGVQDPRQLTNLHLA